MTISQERTGRGTVAATPAAYAQFGLRDGERDESCSQIALGEVAGPHGAVLPDGLYLICEPVEPTARAAPIGASVIAAIRDMYAESAQGDPVGAIAAALAAANDVLYQKNCAGASGLRVFLGVTCLIVRDRELIIGQVPPTQVILAQNGTPIALPELVSWRSDYQPHRSDGPAGLGADAEVAPLLFRASLEPGDLITLCSSNLATVLDEAEIDPLLGDDPIAARDFLAALAERHHLDPAYAAAIAPLVPQSGGGLVPRPDDPAAESDDLVAARGGPGSWFERGLREMRERTQVIHWPRRGASSPSRVVPLRLRNGVMLPWADRAGGRDDPLSHGGAVPVEDDPPAPFVGDYRSVDDPSATGAAAVDDWARQDEQWDGGHETVAAVEDEDAPPPPSRGQGDPLIRRSFWSAAALIVLALGAITEWVRPAGGRSRRIRRRERRREQVWPLGSLERWDRGRGPRLGRRIPLLIVGVLAVLVPLLIISVRGQRAQAAEERFNDALDRVTNAREAAVAAPDRLAAHTQLLALQGELALLPVDDQPHRQERVEAERGALVTALDQVAGVERLGAAQVRLLATDPLTREGATSRPQLVIGGQEGAQPFVLLDGTLYGVDGRSQTLAKLLAKGDSVAGVSVGPLLGIVWRIDNLLAFDETHGYLRDAAGAWSALPLAMSGQKALAADSFGGNLYGLVAERGQIVKFASGAYASPPQPWSSAKVNGDLTLALDLTIDKNIYVLLSDCRVLDFFQGELRGQFAPALVPALTNVSAIYAAPEGQYLYVVDPREGRIVRLTRDGQVVATYQAAPDAPSLVGARDLAVDERAGIAYLLTDAGLLGVQLSPARP